MAPWGEQVSFTCSGVGGTTSTIRWMITILDVVPDNLAEVGIFPPPNAQPLVSTVLINSMESNNGTTLTCILECFFNFDADIQMLERRETASFISYGEEQHGFK